MTDLSTTVPPGFGPHRRSSPITDPWQPLYANIENGIVRLGLHVRIDHCNGRHFLHGGLITSLADNAMGLSVRETMRLAATPDSSVEPSAVVTLSLNVDFVRRANIGDWVEFRPGVRKVGRSISLTDCLVLANDEHLVARATASFKSVTGTS